MKKIYYLFSLLILTGFFVSCEKESENLSRVTHYVEFELEGTETVAVPVGGTYNEPGYVAMEGEDDVTESVQVTDNINTGEIGIYEVNYSAVNQDGFSSAASRTVVVYDPAAPADDLSGTYSTRTVRTEADGSNPRPRSLHMTLTKVGNGVFFVDCLLGNYYSVGSGYGPAYAMRGYVNLKTDYTFDLITSHVQGWGDGLEDFRNASYNTETGELYWEAIYAGADIFATTGTR